MLKLRQPSKVRRRTGIVAGLGLAAFITVSAYASGAITSSHPAPAGAAREYQLDMTLALGADSADARPMERTTVALCMAPGKSGAVQVHGMQVVATTFPQATGRVNVKLAVTRSSGGGTEHMQLRGALGEAMRVEGKGSDGLAQYAVDVTAHSGCPARTASVVAAR